MLLFKLVVSKILFIKVTLDKLTEIISLLEFLGLLIHKNKGEELMPHFHLKPLIQSTNSIFRDGTSEISAKDLVFYLQEQNSVSGLEPNSITKLFQK